MDGYPEPLEKIFQQVEEESERRAQDEHEREKAAGVADKSATEKRHKDRRRGSVSISRIGKPSDDDLAKPYSPPPTPSLGVIAASSLFYQAQIANGSTTSIASGASAFSGAHAHTEDDNHVTQMQHIAGKQSISAKMMPRRLSRSRSASVIPTRALTSLEPSVVIGVSVQENTIKSVPEAGEEPVVTISRRASVQAPNSLRHKASRSTLPSSKPTPYAGWVTRAKIFALKFRRKNKVPVIPS